MHPGVVAVGTDMSDTLAGSAPGAAQASASLQWETANVRLHQGAPNLTRACSCGAVRSLPNGVSQEWR